MGTQGSPESTYPPGEAAQPADGLVELPAAFMSLSVGAGLLLVYNTVTCRALPPFPIVGRDGLVS